MLHIGDTEFIYRYPFLHHQNLQINGLMYVQIGDSFMSKRLVLNFFFFHIALFHGISSTIAETLNFKVLSSVCSGGQYATNSPFNSNLNTLFSSLISNSPSSNFHNETSGNSPDRAYGLFLCQGDLSNDDCRNCVQAAASDILQKCPHSLQGVVWYDWCELRYSDQNFFGVLDSDGFSMTNANNLSDPTRPLQEVSQLVQQASSKYPLMFASEALNSDNIYALAQCTGDLSSSNCSKCLTTILNNITSCCSQARGWRFLTPSCWIRYETAPFLRNINSTYTEIMVSECSKDNLTLTSNQSENNLNGLLSSLVSNGPMSGFYKDTAAGNSDRLYGLVLCRTDVTNNACLSCLNASRSNILQNCPNKTRGIIWYEHCLLRYSNQNFFGELDGDGETFCGEDKASQLADNVTLALMSVLIDKAPNQSLMFAADSRSISNSVSTYGLVQCTRDLSSEWCKTCLTLGLSNVSSICKQTNGWRYLSGSCNLRYEQFAFFGNAISVPTTPQPSDEGSGTKFSKAVIISIIAPILATLLLCSFLYCLWKRRRTHRGFRKDKFLDWENLDSKELHLIDLITIQEATNNFSDENMLGQGGFGCVYKATLPGEKEVAIKRLSSKSNQGSEEFMNEVILIAKLQHRNLVRMLGCCLEGEEKLLVYEYMPNKSLDAFIFDQVKRPQLDWRKRIHIVSGIARGLLYLHEDSQLRIIHRDLKASNVLLDHEMNPKISDFGIARIFQNDENVANTTRVVGTYGYMAPEYAMDGQFSVKSDVFSFGVLLLEILSGERNGRFHFLEYGQGLLRHAWRLWRDGRGLELIDPLIVSSCPTNEAWRCIHIGLLCVQEDAEDRPTISSVVLMLGSEQMELPEPTQPPKFMRERVYLSSDQSSSSAKTHSISEVTVTDVEPR